MEFRDLWGIGSTRSNSLGNRVGRAVAAALLKPSCQLYRRWWLRRSGGAGAVMVFVYTQSKTTLPLTTWRLTSGYWRGIGAKQGRCKGIDIRFAIALISVTSGATFALLLLDIGGLWDKLMLTQAGTDISTLTGRWRKSGVVGVGWLWLRNLSFRVMEPEIWGPAFSVKMWGDASFCGFVLAIIWKVRIHPIAEQCWSIRFLESGRVSFLHWDESHGLQWRPGKLQSAICSPLFAPVFATLLERLLVKQRRTRRWKLTDTAIVIVTWRHLGLNQPGAVAVDPRRLPSVAFRCGRKGFVRWASR